MQEPTERFVATLGRVGELVRLPQAADGAPARLLAALRLEVQAYFASEEGESNFGALLRERPAFAHALDELRHEHSELLAQLDRVCAVADAGERDQELPKLTSDLAEALRAHEHREGELLQEVVLRDDGTSAD
jgi:hypothetical protein